MAARLRVIDKIKMFVGEAEKFQLPKSSDRLICIGFYRFTAGIVAETYQSRNLKKRPQYHKQQLQEVGS